MPRDNLPLQGMRSVGELAVARFALVFERLEQIFGADDLAVERAGNQRVALDIALFCAGDGDAVDLQGAAKGALVIRFGFGEIGEGAELGALRGFQVALRQAHVVALVPSTTLLRWPGRHSVSWGLERSTSRV